MAAGIDPQVDGGGDAECIALLELAARSANGTGDAVDISGLRFDWLALTYIKTAADIAPPLAPMTVWVQHSWDGYNWDDLLAFATSMEVSEAATVQFATLPRRRLETAGELHNQSNAGIAAGTIVATGIGKHLRARWDVGAGVGSHTFQVLALPMRDAGR